MLLRCGPSPVDVVLAVDATNVQKKKIGFGHLDISQREKQGWGHEEDDFPDPMPKPLKASNSFIV